MVPNLRVKKRISIKGLLEYAYAEEMVHAARRPGMPVELAMRTKPALSVGRDMAADVIDSSTRVDFEAPADAYLVHAAVQRLGWQKMTMPREWAADVGDTREWAVDVRGNTMAGEAPGDVVWKIDRSALVFQHAINCSSPDWIASPRVRLKRGHLVYAGRRHSPFQCLISWKGDTLAAVGRARLVYAVWASALAELHGFLAHRVDLDLGFALTDELPPERPWLGISQS